MNENKIMMAINQASNLKKEHEASYGNFEGTKSVLKVIQEKLIDACKNFSSACGYLDGGGFLIDSKFPKKENRDDIAVNIELRLKEIAECLSEISRVQSELSVKIINEKKRIDDLRVMSPDPYIDM